MQDGGAEWETWDERRGMGGAVWEMVCKVLNVKCRMGDVGWKVRDGTGRIEGGCCMDPA